MRILMAGLSDIGSRRDLNEDSWLCAELPGPAFLLAVADGIGGHAAGEVASAAAIETLRAVTAERLTAAGAAPDLAAVLEEAFLRANESVFRQSSQTEHLNGMGTTMVAALIAGERAAAANVGDSRLYFVRDKAASQITADHSWAAEQARAGLLTEADVSRSPFRHMVTRSIGYAAALAVDTFVLDLRPGDGLLLSSDGLFGPLEAKDLLKPFRRKKHPEDICRALVRAADKAGSRDNITAVVALVGRP
ncbi:MAG: protein phosphatase 2C domain-containing protein [Candidatus Aminicenantes bacterium]|nr:protein phosphatase 2C domain-containing protein [Candidatus Aminicenantes bacterium]